MKKTKKFTGDSNLPEHSYLPEDLWREVLVRSPVKTLLKFRCVCKAWCSIIDSSDFISMHQKLYNGNCRSRTQLLVAENNRRIGTVFTVRSSDKFWKIRHIATLPKSHSLLQMCNGLTLIEWFDHANDYAKVAMLWNPSIRKSLILPHCPLHIGGLYAAYVLGFSSRSSDYKVLAFQRNLGIAVYSVNHHRWRVITDQTNKEHFDLLLSRDRGAYAFSGSAMYWVKGDQYGTGALFCFDFDDEELRSVKLPDAVKESKVRFIFPLSGSIAVFTSSAKNSCIWVMEKNGGETGDHWKLWFSGESACKELLSLNIRCPFSNTIYVQDSNTCLMLLKATFGIRMSKKTNKKLISYNITTQQLQHLGKTISCNVSFNTYVQSLVLHKGLEGQNLISFP